jgi:effector-binding domain-containing protein
MDRTFEVTIIDPQPAVAVRTETTPDKIGEQFDGLAQEVFAYILEKGIEPSGPAFIRYFEFSPERVDMEVGLPISRAGDPIVDPDPRMSFVDLPGGDAVVAVHEGSYEGLAGVYEALHDWIHAQEGLEEGDAPWEVYEVSPADTDDPAALRTRVVWPVKRD